MNWLGRAIGLPESFLFSEHASNSTGGGLILVFVYLVIHLFSIRLTGEFASPKWDFSCLVIPSIRQHGTNDPQWEIVL